MTEIGTQLKLVGENPEDPRTILNYEEVRGILGEDFISPEEVSFPYPLFVKEMLLDNLPRAGIIRWCQNNKAVLVAGPPSPRTLLDLHRESGELFFCKRSAWFCSEPFASTENINPGWLILLKEPIKGSNGKSWEEQREMVPSHLEVPKTVDLVWGFVSYARARGGRSIRYKLVKTNSITSKGFPVVAGYLHGGGIELYDWDASQSRDVYITAGYSI